MPKLAGVPTFDTEAFVYYTEPRRRVRSVTVEMVRGWPPSTTPRAGATPLVLRQNAMSTELRIHNTEGGHLLALEFGGPDDERNLVPMWGHFNKHGAWKAFERELGEHVHASGRVQLVITCVYTASIDERIPREFRITSTKVGTTGIPKSWIIPHIPPQPRLTAPNLGFAALVASARTEMNTVFPDGFFVEESFLATTTGQTLRLPGRTMAERPYALLDYMALTATIEFNLLANVENGAAFSAQQREWIMALNRIDNGGLLITDDAADFATVATKHHVDSHGRQIYHGSYIVHDFPLGVLMEEGGDQAPEVDHTIPQSRGGCNAFSNAQVISRAYNQWKSARISDEDARRVEETSRKSKRLSQGASGKKKPKYF